MIFKSTKDMPNNNSNNRRLVRNTAFLYFRMLFVMFVTLYTTRVILSALGTVDYGIYNVVAGFVALFSVLNNCLSTGTNRFYNYALGKNDNEGITKVYNASVRIQFIILVVLFVLLEIIGIWYINNKMVIPMDRIYVAQFLFQCSVVSLLFVVMQIPYSAAVMAYERMDFYALISIIDAIFKLGIAVAIDHVSWDKLATYGCLLTLVSIINFLLYYAYSKKNIKSLKLKKSVDVPLFKKLFSFSAWSTIDPLSYMVRDQGSNMTLNIFFGPIANAAYGIAAQISGAVAGFASNLSIAFRPQMIQAYSSENYSRVKNLMFSMSKVNFIMQMCIAIPLVFEMQYILTLWLGETYPEYTVIFASIVVVINSVNCLNEPVSIIMVATGHIKKIKTISMCIICSIVPFGYLLFTLGCPPYAIYLVMLCLTLINQISCIIIMHQEFKYIAPFEYLRVIIIPLTLFTFLSLIAPSIITYFMSSSFVRLCVLFPVTIILSVTIAYYVCMNTNEQQMFVGARNKIIGKFLRKK